MLSSYSWDKIFQSWIIFNYWIKFVIGLIKIFPNRCINAIGFTLTFWFVIVLVHYCWIANFYKFSRVKEHPLLCHDLACSTGFSAQDLTSRCHQFCHQDLEEVEFLSGEHRVETLLDLSDFLGLEDRGPAFLVNDQHGDSFWLFETSFISHQCFPYDLWAESDA